MYGENVYVTYKGREMRVWIPCVPETDKDALKERAINKLERIQYENPLLTLDDIQEQFDLARL